MTSETNLIEFLKQEFHTNKLNSRPSQAELFKKLHHQAHFVKDNKNETFTLIDFTFSKFLMNSSDKILKIR